MEGEGVGLLVLALIIVLLAIMEAIKDDNNPPEA